MTELNQTDIGVEQTTKTLEISQLDKQSSGNFKDLVAKTLSKAKNGAQTAVLAGALSVAPANAESSDTQTFNLENGYISIIQQNGEYVVDAEVVGTFSQTLLSKKGDALYIIGDGNKVDVLNFGKYEKLGEMIEDEAAFIDFLKSSKQTEFLAMLTIGKAEFLQNGGNLALWSDFMANNLGSGFADISMESVLEKTSALVYFLADKGNTLSYYDDFYEVVLTYKEADGFMEVVTGLAKIAQYKAQGEEYDRSIALNKAQGEEYKAQGEEYKAQGEEYKATLAQLQAFKNNLRQINAMMSN